MAGRAQCGSSCWETGPPATWVSAVVGVEEGRAALALVLALALPLRRERSFGFCWILLSALAHSGRAQSCPIHLSLHTTPLHLPTGMAIWRAIRPKPADWLVDHGHVGWAAPGRPSLLTTTLSGDMEGKMCWQAFAPWPADRLAEIGGGRKACE